MLVHLEHPPERISVTPTPEITETSHLADFELLTKAKDVFGPLRKLGAAAIVPTVLLAAYWTDVDHNRAEQEKADAHVTLNLIAGPLNKENSNKGIILIDGYGSYDSDFLTKTIGPAAQQLGDGQLLSFGYDNANISREAIYKEVLRKCAELGITRIKFVGYSTGGIVGTEATADIVKNSYLNVDAAIDMSTPDGPKGLIPERRANLAFAQWVGKNIPGSTDSSAFLFTNEMISRSGNYTKSDFKEWWDVVHNAGVVFTDIGAFGSSAWEVFNQLNDPQNPSGRLLAQQAFKIQQFSAQDELKTISEQRNTKQMPTFGYLATNDMSMVNDKESALSIQKAADDAGLSFTVELVPDAKHSLYFRSIEEYTRGFKNLSDPINNSVQAEVNLHTMDMYIAQQRAQSTNDALKVGKRLDIE